MNTPRSLGHKQISIASNIFVIIMCFTNLVVISPKLCPAPSAGRSPSYKAECTIGTKQACPSYTRDQLVHIRDTIKHDTRYSKIHFETINRVRKYKINSQPSKLGLNHPNIKQQKTNTKNLVNIDIIEKDQAITKNLRIATVNTRSIKNKVN